MKRRFHSIGYKLISTLVAATTLPMLIYCFFFSYNMRKSAEESYIRDTQHTWNLVAGSIEHSLSASIEVANKGVYLNRTLQDLLFTRDDNTFYYAESPNSTLLFSYLTNIYSMTPEATQIQFSAYKSGKSLLLITRNLQKYIRSASFEKIESPPVNAFRAYIIPPHRQTSYGHQINHMTDYYGSGNLVFTVCLPIYHLPDPASPIGELSIDISMDFFEKACGFLYNDSEQFYIVDSGHHIIFASDASWIGKETAEGWIQELILKATDTPNELISRKTSSELQLCRKLPGNFCDWYMIKSVPKGIIYRESNNQLAGMLFTFGIFLMITILLNGYSILHYTNPLKRATIYLKSINPQTKNLNSRLSDYVTYQSEDEISILFRSLEEMLDTINNFVIRQFELEIMNRTTELKTLEAQINPHFIYNTLQCLATISLAHQDKEQYDYISSFGQLMQYSMDRNHTLVTIQEELSHIDRYIKLQKMRFTSPLSVTFEIEELTEKIVVPKMILQPLIENSFKHGKLVKLEQGEILIRTSAKKDHLLHIWVLDNGCSPPEEELRSINRQLEALREEYINKMLTPFLLASFEEEQKKNIQNAKENLYAANNIGLANVLLRLLLNFGRDCRLELSANEMGGTTVHLVISYETLWNGG